MKLKNEIVKPQLLYIFEESNRNLSLILPFGLM